MSEFPEDDWHTRTYVLLDATDCHDCGLQPDLQWAWKGAPAGEDSAEYFAARAVEYLKRAGWQMAEGMILRCPVCAAKAAGGDARRSAGV